MLGSSVVNGRQHIGLQRLAALAGVVRSSVGPDKKYKFIQDDASGESVLACSCFRIVENLEPTCAADQLVFETIKAHHEVYRSGSGCLLFLAGAWSRAALDCLQRGISVTQIISIMSEGMDVCVDVCRKSSISFEDVAVKQRLAATPDGLGLQSDQKTPNTSVLRKTKLSRHFCETASRSVSMLRLDRPGAPGVAHVAKTLSHGCERSMKLVVEAVQMQSRTNREVSDLAFDISKVMTCVLPGLPEDRACVLHGCVVLLSHEQSSVAHQIKERPLRVALVHGDLSHTYRHLGFKKPPGVQRVREQVLAGPSEEDRWLERIVGVLLRLEVDLVLTAGLACEELIQLCCRHLILVVDKLNASVLRAMAKSSGAVPVTYASQLSEHCVGSGAQVSIWRDLSSFERTSAAAASVSAGGDDGPVTAVITSCVRGKLPALEDQFWACAHRLHNALQDGVLLPGAGGAETLCVHRLQNQAEQRPTETAVDVCRGDVLRLMADGLIDYVTSVMVNAGSFSAVGARTVVSQQLRDRIMAGTFSQLASAGEREASAVFPAVKPDGAPAATIYDNLNVKLQAWRKALDLVFLVLQSDAEVVTGSACRGADLMLL